MIFDLIILLIKRVNGINKKEIKELFGDRNYTFIKTAINPVLLRAVYRFIPNVTGFLEKFNFLKTNYLTLIK